MQRLIRSYRPSHGRGIHARAVAATAAFTLFEVAICLAIVSTAVLSVALMYPSGIRAERLARFQIYAAAKATELMDHWTNGSHTRWERQTEAPKAWDCTFMHTPVDLDRMMEDAQLGLLPLPHAIAQRLDSDNDQIARLLEQGGEVFYVAPWFPDTGYDPRIATQLAQRQGLGADSALKRAPTETQTLLFAVLGYAQQNALPNHPAMAWPYYEYYPSPPQRREIALWRRYPSSWPNTAEFEKVAGWMWGDVYDDHWSQQKTNIDGYFLAAVDLVQKLSTLPGSHVSKTAFTTTVAGMPDWAPALPQPLPPSFDPDQDAPNAWEILALRYLAHAAISRTAPAFFATDAAGEAEHQQYRDYADLCNEASMAWAMRYSSMVPYDWGAPRPLNRQTCFDFPLLEYDLQASTVLEPSPSSPGNNRCWPVIGRKKATWFGVAAGMYGGWPGTPIGNDVADPWTAAAVANANDWNDIDGSWGDATHFNLTARFSAAERARRLVCWSVDWRSYQDFESTPTDPCDANVHFLDSAGVCVSSERSGVMADVGLHFADAGRSTFFRMPLRNVIVAGPRTALWESAAYKRSYLGLFGADRNGNGVFDTGPLPASVRVRATTVAAFDFYDRRFIAAARN